MLGSYQHPASLSVMQLSFEAGGDELPQLRVEALHHQVGQDLPAGQGTQSTQLTGPQRFPSVLAQQ